ncbi:hypothetical protein PR048_015210 [Dryococelus australis]|uniref:Uncharacterized protein n=1 Tax=Dryococelus australis TaxID=614101 RepID=A0ABQ9HGB3_9NEOP|nr:hypothetical protein PR048_015210 [Dryococelus australis]
MTDRHYQKYIRRVWRDGVLHGQWEHLAGRTLQHAIYVACCSSAPIAVHTRHTQQGPVTRVGPGESECTAATHERVARHPFGLARNKTQPSIFSEDVLKGEPTMEHDSDTAGDEVFELFPELPPPPARLPPRLTGINPRLGHRIFASGNRAGGFSRGSPVSPTSSFRRHSIFTSITLIGSQDRSVKSRPNLFTSTLLSARSRSDYELEPKRMLTQSVSSRGAMLAMMTITVMGLTASIQCRLLSPFAPLPVITFDPHPPLPFQPAVRGTRNVLYPPATQLMSFLLILGLRVLKKGSADGPSTSKDHNPDLTPERDVIDDDSDFYECPSHWFSGISHDPTYTIIPDEKAFKSAHFTVTSLYISNFSHIAHALHLSGSAEYVCEVGLSIVTASWEIGVERYQTHLMQRGRGDVVVRLSASHQGEPSSIPDEVAPGFSHDPQWLVIKSYPNIRLVRMEHHMNPRVGKCEVLEKTRLPVASSGKIPTCESPGVARPGIEPGSPWWEANILTAQPPRPRILGNLLASYEGDQGSIPGRVTQDFRMWESCGTMPLIGGFSRGSPVSPALSFRRHSIIISITLIGSQDLTHIPE